MSEHTPPRVPAEGTYVSDNVCGRSSFGGGWVVLAVVHTYEQTLLFFSHHFLWISFPFFFGSGRRRDLGRLQQEQLAKDLAGCRFKVLVLLAARCPWLTGSKV